MRTSFLFFLVVALAGACFAQMRNMAVDESAAMKNVHKVAIFINLGPAAAARYRPDFERAKKQIEKKLEKQKLRLVADPADADLVLVVTEYNTSTGAIAHGNGTTAIATDLICLADEIKVYKGGKTPAAEDAPVWSASDSCGFSWPLNRLMDKFGKAINK